MQEAGKTAQRQATPPSLVGCHQCALRRHSLSSSSLLVVSSLVGRLSHRRTAVHSSPHVTRRAPSIRTVASRSLSAGRATAASVTPRRSHHASAAPSQLRRPCLPRLRRRMPHLLERVCHLLPQLGEDDRCAHYSEPPREKPSPEAPHAALGAAGRRRTTERIRYSFRRSGGDPQPGGAAAGKENPVGFFQPGLQRVSIVRLRT